MGNNIIKYNLVLVGLLCSIQIIGQKNDYSNNANDSIWIVAKLSFLDSIDKANLNCDLYKGRALLNNSIAFSHSTNSLFDFIQSNIQGFDNTEYYVYEMFIKERGLIVLFNCLGLNIEYLLESDGESWKTVDEIPLDFHNGKSKFNLIRLASCVGEKNIGIPYAVVLYQKNENNLALNVDCEMCNVKVNMLWDR